MTHPAAAAATAAGHKYRAHQQAQAMAAAAGQAPPALAHALRDVLSLGANPERRPVDLHQGVAKGTWLPEEDKILIAYVAHHGPKDWNKLQTRGLLKRNGKSCRLRWVNQLKPGLQQRGLHGKGCKRFTESEERQVIKLQKMMGNKWAQISKFLPGRTDNDVKNFWNLYIKRLKRIKGHHETLQQAHEDRELAAGGGGGDGGASGLAGGHGEPHDHHHGASRSEHLQQGLSAGAGAGAGHYEMGGQGPISSGSPSMSAGGGEGDLQDDPARASVSSHQGSPSPIQGQVQNQSQGQGQEAAILAGYTGIKHRLEPGKHVWPLQQRRREKAQARLGGSNGGACGGGAGCGSDISSALASNTSNLTGLTIDTSKVADKPAEMLLQQQDNIEDWLKTPTPSRHPMYVYPSSTYRYSPKYLSPRSPMTWSPGAFYSPRITRLRSPLPGGSEMSGDLSGSSLSLPGGLSAAMQPSQFSLADFEAAAGGSDAGSRLGLPLGGGGGGGAGLPGFEPAGARAEPLLDLSHHSNLGYQFQRPSHLGPSGSELLSKGGTTQPVQMMSAAASSQLSSTHLHLSGVPTKASGGAEIDMIATPGGGVGGGSMMVPLDMPLSKSPAGGGGQLAASLPFSEMYAPPIQQQQQQQPILIGRARARELAHPQPHLLPHHHHQEEQQQQQHFGLAAAAAAAAAAAVAAGGGGGQEGAAEERLAAADAAAAAYGSRSVLAVKTQWDPPSVLDQFWSPRQMEDLGSLGGGVLGNEHHAIMGTGGSGGIGVLLRSKSEKSGLERVPTILASPPFSQESLPEEDGQEGEGDGAEQQLHQPSMDQIVSGGTGHHLRMHGHGRSHSFSHSHGHMSMATAHEMLLQQQQQELLQEARGLANREGQGDLFHLTKTCLRLSRPYLPELVLKESGKEEEDEQQHPHHHQQQQQQQQQQRRRRQDEEEEEEAGEEEGSSSDILSPAQILGGGLKWEAGQQQPLGGSNGSGSGVLSRHHQHQSLSLGQSHSLKAGPGHSSYNGRALEREHLMLRATSASCLLDMPGSAGQLSSSSCERLRVARSHEGPLLGGGQVAAYEQLQVGSLGTTIPRALLRKSLGSYQQQVKAGGGMEGTMMLPIMETEASARAAARAARVAGAGGGGADGGRMDGRRGASSGGIKMEGGEQGEAGGPDASWQVEELIRSMLADNHDDLEPSPTSVPGVPAFSGSGSGSGGADQPFADVKQEPSPPLLVPDAATGGGQLSGSSALSMPSPPSSKRQAQEDGDQSNEQHHRQHYQHHHQEQQQQQQQQLLAEGVRAGGRLMASPQKSQAMSSSAAPPQTCINPMAVRGRHQHTPTEYYWGQGFSA